MLHSIQVEVINKLLYTLNSKYNMRKITIIVIILLIFALLFIRPYTIESETIDYGISNTHIQKGICIGIVQVIEEYHGVEPEGMADSFYVTTGSKCSGIPILLSEVLPGLGPLN